MRNVYSEAGFALPICLIIMLLISLSVTNAQQTALMELKLSSAVIEARKVYGLAEKAMHLTMAHVAFENNELPLPGEPLRLNFSPEGTSVSAEINHIYTDTLCPQYSAGERHHYEIKTTATLGAAARRSHLQGFYLCREICVVTGCTPEHSAPVLTYWTVDN